MILLGLKIDTEIKKQLEINFENELTFTESNSDFMKALKTRKYEAIIIDQTNFQKNILFDIIRSIKSIQKNSVIIIFGEVSNLDMVAGSIKAGAYDYVLKNDDFPGMVAIIEKSVKDHKLLAEKVGKNRNTGDKLIGRSNEIIEMYKKIGKIGSINAPVLVFGEKGTGKTSVAKAIHEFSNSPEMPFISINCLSFPSELLEKRIFGSENEIKNGSVMPHISDLEKANGGTLHLGNIEALTLGIQSKLLYFLEENKFYRVGGSEALSPKIRIVATTSENLEDLIAQGKFIDELYRKLNVLEVSIPPLRDRVEDIPLIIDHYLVECNEELHKAVKGVSKPALNRILRYDWPGNVNELKITIKSAVAMCRGNSILIDDLPATVLGKKVIRKKGDSQILTLRDWVKSEIAAAKGNAKNNYYSSIISKLEKELIKQVLEITNGKKTETAELLGITRNTLRSKMDTYNLD